MYQGQCKTGTHKQVSPATFWIFAQPNLHLLNSHSKGTTTVIQKRCADATHLKAIIIIYEDTHIPRRLQYILTPWDQLTKRKGPILPLQKQTPLQPTAAGLLRLNHLQQTIHHHTQGQGEVCWQEVPASYSVKHFIKLGGCGPSAPSAESGLHKVRDLRLK